jgi:hypothetical protein
MKKNPLLFIVTFFIFYSCTGPEKETVNVPDSLTLQSPPVQAKITTVADTVTPDAALPQNVFVRTDSQTFFVLRNYFSSSTEKPVRSQVQVIDSTCAILIYPTPDQLKGLQEEFGAGFDQVLDDNTYYQGLAIEMLDSIDVETINAEKRFITFKGTGSGTWTLDIRKQGAPAWNLIFFNDSKEPLIVPMSDLSHRKIIEYFDVKTNRDH